MKKLFSSLFVLLLGVFLLGSFNVKANGGPLVESIDGASIRTTGEQGLRFSAKLAEGVSVENIKEHGFYVIYGKATVADLQRALTEAGEGNVIINGKEAFKVKVEGLDPKGQFNVVLIGIPEQGFMDGISVVPYAIEVGKTELVFVEPVTRSIGQVALAIAEAGGEVPEAIASLVNTITEADYTRVGFVGDKLEIAKGINVNNPEDYKFYLDAVTITLPEAPEKEEHNFLYYTLEGTLYNVGDTLSVSETAISFDLVYEKLSLMIHEAYGGGGNSGAHYKYDYVVLYNGTNADIDLTDYSIQYASATGSFAGINNLTGIIKAKDYFLIQMAAGSGGVELPIEADYVGNIPMGAKDFKLALVDGTESILDSGPEHEKVVDFLGVGSANKFEGNSTSAASNSTSAIRKIAGVDTDNNNADFKIVATNLNYLISADYVDVSDDADALELPPSFKEGDVLTLITEGTNGSTISWESSHPLIIDIYGTVNVPATNTNVTLTATITKGDASTTKVFNILVLAKGAEYLSIAEVRQLDVNDEIEFVGVLSGLGDWNSQFSNFEYAWIEDDTGAIYIRGAKLSQDAELGGKYKIEGKIANYMGLVQIDLNATFELLDTEISLQSAVEVTDITTLTVDDQGKRLIIEGTVVSVSSPTGQEMVVKVGNNNITVRAYATSGLINSHMLTAIIGQKVNLVAIHLSWFNGAQLLPNAISQIEFIDFTDEELLLFAYDEYLQEYNNKIYNMGQEFDLPLEGIHESTIVWNESEYIVDGLFVDVEEDTNFTLTGEITVGEATQQISLSLTIKYVDPEGPNYVLSILSQSDFGNVTNPTNNYSLFTNRNVKNGQDDPSPEKSTSWDFSGGNNNSTNWEYIRMGGKASANHLNPTVYLKTNFIFNTNITKITINVLALDSASGYEKIYIMISNDNEKALSEWTVHKVIEIENIGRLVIDNLNIPSGHYVNFVFERGDTGSNNRGTDIDLITFYGLVESLSNEELFDIAEADLKNKYDDKEFDMDTEIALENSINDILIESWISTPNDAIVNGKWKVVSEDTEVTLTAKLKIDDKERVVNLYITIKFIEENGGDPEPATPELLYSYNFLDGGSSGNNSYAGTGLNTNVSYASDNPGGTSETTSWIADYANLSLSNGTRLGGKLVSTEYGSPNANIRTDFAFEENITKIEILGASTFGTAGNITTIFLQTSTDGITWTTIESTTTKTGTITFDELNIASGSYIKIVVELKASGTNSGLAFTGLKVTGYPKS